MTWNPGASLPLPPPAPVVAPLARPENRAVIVVCWLVIIGVVIFTAVENWQSSHDKRMDRAASAVEMEITARTVVGSFAWSREFGMGAQVQQKLPELVQKITSSATDSKQELMATAVIGELQGKAAALAQLDSIDTKLKSLSGTEDGPDLRKDAALLRTIYTASPGALSQIEQARVELRLGWFGNLALVYGVNDSDPERSAILHACKRAFIATLSIEVLLVVLLLAGLVLMIFAIYKLWVGTLYLNYKPKPNVGSAFIEMFALYIVGFITIGRIAHALHVTSQLPVYGIASIWIAGCCCWPLVRGLSFREIRTGLGWTTCRGVFTEAAAGLIGYLTFMPMLALAIALSALLASLGNERAIHPIVFEAGNQSKSAMIGLYLLASGFAPIVEETMFRGALFHHLRRRHRWLLSAALTALIFAAVHPQGWTAIPVLGGIGFSFAGIREWRGNIIASGTAHAINNGVAMTMLFLILG